MLWHIKLVKISPELWICRSCSIWWKLDFYQLCSMTAGCNFYNQLLFTACCLITVSWIKANRVSSLPILFCPLTVFVVCPPWPHPFLVFRLCFGLCFGHCFFLEVRLCQYVCLWKARLVSVKKVSAHRSYIQKFFDMKNYSYRLCSSSKKWKSISFCNLEIFIVCVLVNMS